MDLINTPIPPVNAGGYSEQIFKTNIHFSNFYCARNTMK